MASKLPLKLTVLGSGQGKLEEFSAGDMLDVSGVLFGSSAVPANNFIVEPLGDGTLQIRRASGAVVLTINADGSIVGPFLGSGQSRQLVTASRAFGVNYTNTSNRPLFVNITLAMTTVGAGAGFFIAGIPAGTHVTTIVGGFSSLYGVVMPGEVYGMTIFSGAVSGFSWVEIRQ